MAAIAIILILAGILLGGIFHATKRAEDAKTRAIVELLADAVEKYHSERRVYPRGNGEVFFYRSGTQEQLKMVVIRKKDDGSVEYKKEYDFFSKHTGRDYMEVNWLTATATTLEKAEPLLDAWEQNMKYRCPGGHNKTSFDIWSIGATGEDDTDTVTNPADDITNWNDLL